MKEEHEIDNGQITLKKQTIHPPVKSDCEIKNRIRKKVKASEKPTTTTI